MRLGWGDDADVDDDQVEDDVKDDSVMVCVTDSVMISIKNLFCSGT